MASTERNMLTRFGGDESGSFGTIFCLMLPMFVLMVGAAVDLTRTYAAQEQLQKEVDSATLAGTRHLALNPSATDKDVRDIVADHLGIGTVNNDPRVACGAPTITIDRVEITVSVALNCEIATLFPVYENEFSIGADAQSDFEYADLEVAFMIDISGSMRGSRLRDMQEALRKAKEVLFNSSSGSVRIAYAPYATAVNAGAYAEDATNLSRSHNCVTERRDNQDNAFTDAPPREEFFRRRSSSCAATPILPLTDNDGVLDAHINSLNATGLTAGHLGIAWSWYLISPRWSYFWPIGSQPAPAGDAKKAVIIMTDGMFNRRYESGNGDSSEQSLEICDEMRREGILVYSIGFRAPESVKPTLQSCATTTAQYYDSNSGEALIAAYASIAEDLASHTLRY